MIYVDDTLVMSENPELAKSVIKEIQSHLKTDEPKSIGKILGIHIEQEADLSRVTINAYDYIMKLDSMYRFSNRCFKMKTPEVSSRV